jgi:hypothetical protein
MKVFIPSVNTVLNKFDSDKYSILMLGRTSSKCKITHYIDDLMYLGNLTQVVPSPLVTNSELLTTISSYKYTLTGFYWGGEGEPEKDDAMNKLEWSYLDAVLSYSIPVTSSLFRSHLNKLGIDTPILDYMNPKDDIPNLKAYLNRTPAKDFDNFSQYYDIILNELRQGNGDFRKIFNGTNTLI